MWPFLVTKKANPGRSSETVAFLLDCVLRCPFLVRIPDDAILKVPGGTRRPRDPQEAKLMRVKCKSRGSGDSLTSVKYSSQGSGEIWMCPTNPNNCVHAPRIVKLNCSVKLSKGIF